MRKKIGCVVLMMIVSMVMLASTALAASFNVKIKPNKNFDDVAVNGEIIYTITTSQPTNNFNFDVTFDNTLLEYVGCLTTGLDPAVVDENVNCIYSVTGGTGLSEIQLKFKKKADSTEPVKIELINCKFTPSATGERLPEDQVSIVFEDVAKAGTETQTGSETGTQTGTETGTQTGTENGTQTGSETGTTTGTENGTQKGAENTAKENKKEENKKDNSQANKNLPQTGSSNVLVLATISAMAVVAGAGIAMKKNN